VLQRVDQIWPLFGSSSKDRQEQKAAFRHAREHLSEGQKAGDRHVGVIGADVFTDPGNL